MLALKQPVNFISLVPPQVGGQPIDLDEQLVKGSQRLTLPIYLPGAVRNTRRLKATDPLDRFMGCLTIDCQPSDINIYYKKSPAEAYTGAARFTVTNTATCDSFHVPISHWKGTGASWTSILGTELKLGCRCRAFRDYTLGVRVHSSAQRSLSSKCKHTYTAC